MLHMTSVKQKNRAAYPVGKVGGQTDGRTRPNSIVPTFFKCRGLNTIYRIHTVYALRALWTTNYMFILLTGPWEPSTVTKQK